MSPMAMMQMLGGGGGAQGLAGLIQNPAIQQVLAQLIQGGGQPPRTDDDYETLNGMVRSRNQPGPQGGQPMSMDPPARMRTHGPGEAEMAMMEQQEMAPARPPQYLGPKQGYPGPSQYPDDPADNTDDDPYDGEADRQGGREMIPEEEDTADREPRIFGSDEDMLEHVRRKMGADQQDDVQWEGDIDSGPTPKDIEELLYNMDVPGHSVVLDQFIAQFGEENLPEEVKEGLDEDEVDEEAQTSGPRR